MNEWKNHVFVIVIEFWNGYKYEVKKNWATLLYSILHDPASPKILPNYVFIGGPSHMYSGSKSGSKSFDELDDLLSASSEKNKKPKKSKTMSSENTSRHSCDELMMTRSLHEAETSDTGSQVSIFLLLTWVCLKNRVG